jgi:MFS transporter, SP family, general alpha glucoside:H+ symporter
MGDPSHSEKSHPSEFLEFVTLGSPSFSSGANLSETKKSLSPTTQHAENESPDLPPMLAVGGQITQDVKAGVEAEHKMTFIQGARLYPKAIIWSMLISATIVMEGFSASLIGNFFGFPKFRQAYGSYDGTHGYQISPAWQTGLPNGACVGEILGLLLNGYLTDRFGYQKTVIGALLWLCVFITLAFFAFNIQMLMAYSILCGLPWGIFQTLTTTYASEVVPVALRAYLTSNVNMCWLVGQLLSTGIIRGLVQLDSQWSYRIPFSFQWVFTVPILIGVFFSPESPWWLVRHGKPEEARKSLLRLTQRDQAGFNVDDTVAMMQHTNEVEISFKEGTSYMDCFRGSNLRRTEITIMVWVTQALCGGPLIGYAAYFFEQAGFDARKAFELGIGMFALAMLGNIICWIIMQSFGRRTLYLAGLAVCSLVMIAIGAVSCLSESSTISWTLGGLVIFLTFAFNCTIGPVCYSLVSELPSTRLRVKTVVLARVMYNVTCIITNILAGRMLNPTAWNWKGKTGFVFAGLTLICLAYCYLRLPEPKGLTYLELDILFENNAKAKKFKALQRQLAETGYFSVTDESNGGMDWVEHRPSRAQK